MRYKFRVSFAVLLTGLLVACRSGVKLDQAAHANHATTAPSSAISAPSDLNTVQEVDAEPLNDLTNPIAQHSVYFDFDEYTVKDEYQSLLRQHAQYLKSHPERQLRIEGNTDERGASEYNIALGQKRAEAVRRVLSLMGIPDSQMEVVSLGKEKPRALGHDEASWAENRRVDLVYPQ